VDSNQWCGEFLRLSSAPSGAGRGHTHCLVCAASLRSRVSRRSRLKMTVASRQRGESWNPGRRCGGTESDFPFQTLPATAIPQLWSLVSPLASRGHGLRRPCHSRVSGLCDASSVSGTTSWGSQAGSAAAGGGREASEETQDGRRSGPRGSLPPRTLALIGGKVN
jgi:hypothetical protein